MFYFLILNIFLNTGTGIICMSLDIVIMVLTERFLRTGMSVLYIESIELKCLFSNHNVQ